MTVRFWNMYDPREGKVERCCIGRHKVTEPNFIFFGVDGKPMCRQHVFEVVGAMDRYYKSKDTEERILDAYRRVSKVEHEAKRKANLRKIAGRNDPGFVYYIRMDDLIKIGYAKDVSRRMRAYPPSAELLALHPGTPALERQMHQQFHAFLRQGREWFAPHEQVMDHISTVREKFGNPAPFAYSYRKSATA